MIEGLQRTGGCQPQIYLTTTEEKAKKPCTVAEEELSALDTKIRVLEDFFFVQDDLDMR